MLYQPLDLTDAKPFALELVDELRQCIEHVVDGVALQTLALAVRQADGAVLCVHDEQSARPENAANLLVQARAILALEMPHELGGVDEIDAVIGDRQDEGVAARDQPVAGALAQ